MKDVTLQNKKRGISLMILLITIVIMIIIATAVIITMSKNDQVNNATKATMQSDMKTMLDNYETVYNDKLYEYLGDVTKLKDEDFYHVIPEKYRDTFKATLDGVIYFGTDKQTIDYAIEVGILINGIVRDIAIRNIYVTSNINSITIATNLEGTFEHVEYVYYYRKEGTTPFISANVSNNRGYTISNLIANQRYEVKVEVTDQDTGKKAISETIKIVTNEIVLGSLTFRYQNASGELYEESIWAKDSIHVALNQSVSGTSSYSVTGGNVVANTNESTTLVNEGISTATVTTTNAGTSSKNKTYQIKIDKTAPTGELNFTKVTTNSATARIENISDNSNGQKDVSGVKNYTFYLDGTLVTTQDSPEYTFRNFVQGSTHTVKVVIRDKAMNERVLQKQVTIKQVDDGAESIITSYLPNIWTNQDVIAKIEYRNGNVDDLIAQYSENNVDWQDVSNFYTTNPYPTNRMLYARYRDSRNQVGKSKLITIQNIDKLPPIATISINSGNVYEIPVGGSAVSSNVTLEAREQEATSQYGKSGLKETQFAWSSSQTVEPTAWRDFISGSGFSSNLSGGDHYLWVKVTDNAGNRSSTKVSSALSVKYRIEYHGNNNSGGVLPAAQSKIHNQDITLSNSTLQKVGYTQDGWNTAANGQGTNYVAGGKYTANVPIRLYAKWIANTYQLTYAYNGANSGNTVASKTVTYDSPYDTLPTPGKEYTITLNYQGATGQNTTPNVKTANIFGGWFLENTYVNTITKDSLVKTAGNHTIYAKWTSTIANLPTPIKAGYVFDGWYTAASGGTKRVSGYTPTASETLYAHWSDNAAPTVTLSASPAGWTDGIVRLTGKASDTGGVVAYQFSTNASLNASSGGWNPITSQTSITMTFDAASFDVYYFYAKDAAGNVSKAAATAYIDTIAPNAFTITPDISTKSKVIVAGSTTDAAATATSGQSNGITYRYSKDNGSTWQASNTFTGLTENSYTFKMRATDAAGNVRTSAGVKIGALKSIYIMQLPTKLEYESDENAMKYSGLMVMGEYTIGEDILISGYEKSATPNNDIANKKKFDVTIEYQGKTATFDAFKKGWYGVPDGNWYYYENEKKVVNEQKNIKWTGDATGQTTNTYFFNEYGVMHTGWRKVSAGYQYYAATQKDVENSLTRYRVLVETGELAKVPRGGMVKGMTINMHRAADASDPAFRVTFNASGICTGGLPEANPE